MTTLLRGTTLYVKTISPVDETTDKVTLMRTDPNAPPANPGQPGQVAVEYAPEVWSYTVPRAENTAHVGDRKTLAVYEDDPTLVTDA